jgi:hypothetical protein
MAVISRFRPSARRQAVKKNRLSRFSRDEFANGKFFAANGANFRGLI